MIPLKYEGYETISFINLIRRIMKLDIVTDETLVNAFKEIFFDPSLDFYRKLSFSDNEYSFLNTPLRKSIQKGVDGYKKEVFYFKQSSAQNYILSFFSINPANIRTFFKRVEKYCSTQYRIGSKETLSFYSDQKVAEIKEYNNALPETYRININDYWNVYLRYKNVGHKYIALGMLLLVSILNTTVISFLPSIKKTIIFKSEPIINLNEITGRKLVIRSSMARDLFLCHQKTKEPMNGEDRTILSKRILYTSNAMEIDLSNAIFEIEQVDKRHLRKSPDDLSFGGRMIGFLNKPLSWAYGFILPFERMAQTVQKLKKMDTFYIKATFYRDGHEIIRYLSYINWYKESRLLLLEAPTDCSAWYIDMKKNGKSVIIPYGTIQYNIMALDIPNATQTTYRIPMWLFPQNFTEAQKFYFHEIIQ